jgi:hypothetical protein
MSSAAPLADLEPVDRVLALPITPARKILILARRASEGSLALPSLARRANMRRLRNFRAGVISSTTASRVASGLSARPYCRFLFWCGQVGYVAPVWATARSIERGTDRTLHNRSTRSVRRKSGTSTTYRCSKIDEPQASALAASSGLLCRELLVNKPTPDDVRRALASLRQAALVESLAGPAPSAIIIDGAVVAIGGDADGMAVGTASLICLCCARA